MARIRTIKPEFFTSDDIVSLSPLARLFYVSLWCEADREGRLSWNMRTLKMRYLPADDCDVQDLADELINAGLIRLYEVSGKTYAFIPTFKQHQIINNRESDSVLPEPPDGDDSAFFADASVTRESGGLGEGRKERKGREGKGKEGNSREYTRGDRSGRRTSLPDDFEISDGVRSWAERKGFDQLEEHLERFKAKCLANGYQYADWDAAFRNAIQDDWAGLRKRGAPSGSAPRGGAETQAPARQRKLLTRDDLSTGLS